MPTYLSALDSEGNALVWRKHSHEASGHCCYVQNQSILTFLLIFKATEAAGTVAPAPRVWSCGQVALRRRTGACLGSAEHPRASHLRVCPLTCLSLLSCCVPNISCLSTKPRSRHPEADKCLQGTEIRNSLSLTLASEKFPSPPPVIYGGYCIYIYILHCGSQVAGAIDRYQLKHLLFNEMNIWRI